MMQGPMTSLYTAQQSGELCWVWTLGGHWPIGTMYPDSQSQRSNSAIYFCRVVLFRNMLRPAER